MTNRAVPEGNFVDLDTGIRLHFHGAGSGHPILFIHGSGPGASGWSNFKGNYPFLAEHGYHCLIPDLPGYGYSDKPTNEDYTLDFFADHLVSFLRSQTNQKATLIGNSLGGAVAIRISLKHPELVSKLVLMAPGGLEKREVYMEMEGIQSMMKSFFSKNGITKEGMLRTFKLQLFDENKITDEIINERYEIALEQPKHVIASMRVNNQEEELKDIAVPILGFWGRNDKFCPLTGAAKLQENCRDIRMMTLSNCGHWVMVEHGHLFNNITLTFLKEFE